MHVNTGHGSGHPVQAHWVFIAPIGLLLYTTWLGVKLYILKPF